MTAERIFIPVFFDDLLQGHVRKLLHKQKSSSASFGTTTSRASGSVSADTADSSGTDEEIIRQLREQLAQKDRQIEEFRGKLREQRDFVRQA